MKLTIIHSVVLFFVSTSLATAQSEAHIRTEVSKVASAYTDQSVELVRTLGQYPKAVQGAALDLAKTPDVIPVLLYTAQAGSYGDGMELSDSQKASVDTLQNYLDVLSVLSSDLGATALLGKAYQSNEVVFAQVVGRLATEPKGQQQTVTVPGEAIANEGATSELEAESTIAVANPTEVAVVGDAWGLQVQENEAAARELISARAIYVAKHPRAVLGFSVHGTTVSIFRAPSVEFAEFVVLNQRSYPALHACLMLHWGQWASYYDTRYSRARTPFYWTHRPKAVLAWKARPKKVVRKAPAPRVTPRQPGPKADPRRPAPKANPRKPGPRVKRVVGRRRDR